MRWSLSAMLLAITIIASAFGVYRAFWIDNFTNHSLLLGAFILLLCVAIVAAIPQGSRLRTAFTGTALFGSLYLVCVLRAGFGLANLNDWQTQEHNTKVGFALMGISFLATRLCIILQTPSQAAEQRRPDATSAK